MNVLVTGCAGFIGSNFVRWLLQNDSQVRVTNLDALKYAGNLESIKDLLEHPRHKFVKGDICDENLTFDLVAKNDLVINFAAESHVDRSIDGPTAFVDSNIYGTFSLLEACRKQNRKLRFVQVSTDEVYGSLGDQGKFTELSPLAPNNPYSASKASADLLVRSYQTTFGLDTITTRCSNNYGPYQFPEKLIPLIIQNALKDKDLPVYGDGQHIRDWTHVQDHNRGVWLAATKGKSGEIYNIGADNEWTNLDLIKKILQILEKPESLIKFVKDRPGHDRRYAIDATKSKNELGWSPEIEFEKGLEETVNWYLDNKIWVEHVMSGSYREFYDRWYKGR